MANYNSQLQTAYQQGSASLDHNSFKKQKFAGKAEEIEATLVQESADLSPEVNMWILQDSWTL